ncbi:unnamed protein product, partial [Closterium sp. NIES-54]
MGKIGVWILALGGGVLTLLYLLPWAHIALDLLGNCRDAPRAVQEVSLVQKPHRRSLSSPSKRSSTKARPISARITTAPSTASTSTRCACRDSPMILISTEDYACRSGSNQRGRFPRAPYPFKSFQPRSTRERCGLCPSPPIFLPVPCPSPVHPLRFSVAAEATRRGTEPTGAADGFFSLPPHHVYSPSPYPTPRMAAEAPGKGAGFAGAS